MATSINKILVPLDNSKNSFRGLSSAIYLAKNCDNHNNMSKENLTSKVLKNETLEKNHLKNNQ